MDPRDSPALRGARGGGSMRAAVFGGISILMGLVVAVFISAYVAKKSKSAAGTLANAPVVCAREPIPTGATITDAMLEVRKYPPEAVPEGAITDVGGARDRVVRFPLAKGEPIVEHRLASMDSGRDPSALVPPDLRAVVVKINDALASANLLRPGMIVDVIVTSPPVDDRGALARLILSKVQILAVGDRFSFEARKTGVSDLLGGGGETKSDGSTKNVVTLLVTPDQAERLALANREGEVNLAVRNVADPGEPAPPGVNMRELLNMGGYVPSEGSSSTSPTGVPIISAESARRRARSSEGGRSEPSVQVIR